MSDAADPAETVDESKILFSSSYGGFPRFIWFTAFPFLLLVSSAFFVDGVWFGGRLMLHNLRVPQAFIVYVVCPVMWCLCGLIVALEVYRHWNPQFVLISTWGVRLPKGRFTADNLAIAWDDLTATLESTHFKGLQVHEFHFEDVRNGERASISSALFRRYADFTKFATILGKQMRRDWPIKGVGPGRARRTKSARG